MAVVGESEKSQSASARGMNQLLTNLVKSSGIYAVASSASPLISLALMPFLTHALAPADYGALAVLNTVIALVSGMTQLGLAHAFFRAYSCDYESRRDRLHVVSTVVLLMSLSSIPVVIAMMVAAPWLSQILFNSRSFSDPIRLAALVILVQNFSMPGLSWLRAESRAASFSVLSITNLLVNLGVSLVLVGIFHMGLEGALLAVGSGYAVVVVCTLPVILIRAGLHLRFDVIRNLLSFGVPLVAGLIAAWILQLSDRYLLSVLGSLTQTASYTVAYTLGGALGTLILTPFSLAWPTAMFTIAKKENAVQVFRLVFRWYSIVLLFVAFGLSLVGRVVLDLFFPHTYYVAAPIIPIIALSIVFYGIYDVFTIGASIQRKTWLEVIFVTFSALVNVGFNIILIPIYGSMGAALATLIAYVALAIVTYLINQQLYPIPFEIGKFMLALLIGIVLYVASIVHTQDQQMYVAWSISLALLALYGGCLLLWQLLLLLRENT